MNSTARAIVWLAFIFFGLPVIAVMFIGIAYAIAGVSVQ